MQPGAAFFEIFSIYASIYKVFLLTGSAQKVLSMELVPPNSKKRLSTLVPPNIPRMAKF